MQILIARHGQAVNVGEQGITRDFDRPLSATGIKQITQVANGIKLLGIKPAMIICSPFKRTIETATLFAKIINNNETVVVSAHLESGARFEDYKEAIDENNLWGKYNNQAVLFVGHAPDVGKVCDVLACMKGFSFETGNVAQIQVESPGAVGVLTGFWSPGLYSNTN